MRTLFTMLCLGFLAVSALAAEKAKPSPLFDGKTLDGWEGNLKVFRVEDGSIVGGGLKAPVARNEFLTAKKEYGDFELRLKFKLVGAGANAGVQLRSRRIPNHHEMIGYQADMGDGYWGCLYDESRRNKVLAGPKREDAAKALKRGDWNEYRIVCQGPRIQLWLNGQKTVDYTEPDAKIERKGLIGVQIHGGGPSEAWYKDIQIKEL
ncbi:MAG: 3-keto-disaccharide hydrolase [Pirellulales bacterium]